MIPLPQLLSELMLGLGAALFGANLLVAIRSRRPPPSKKSKRPAPTSMSRVYFNMALGAIVALVGLAAVVRNG